MNHTLVRRRPVRILTTLGVAALVGFGTLVAASPASAAALNPANKIGDLILTPTTGAMANGDWFKTGGSISSDATCPADTEGSRNKVVSATGEEAIAASAYRHTLSGALTTGWGMDGEPLHLTPTAPLPTGTGVNQLFTNFSALGAGYTGEFDFVVTCDPGFAAGTQPIGDSPYFSIRLVSDGTNWTVKESDPVEKTDTTLELGGTALSTGAVQLSATVKADGSAATGATGQVTFTGTPGGISGTGTVTNGVAQFSTDVLTAGTEYTFTASYAGDTAYEGSSSNKFVVTTVAEPVEPITTEITVQIPQGGPGTLAFSGADTATLATATESASTFDADGSLSAVTITDSRETKSRWTVNGKVSPFEADGLTDIGANVLGWTPAPVGTLPPGVAKGNAVQPGTGKGDGLAVDRPLASAVDGYAAAGTTATAQVEAALRFSAPKAGVQAGNYRTTLTLTLIS
ncbi:hypothetical protein GCM10027416_16820 [Okibacterium endophyticum]